MCSAKDRKKRMTDTDLGFDYRSVLESETSDRAISIIAAQVLPATSLRAVIWSDPRQTWIYAPGPAARFMYDDQYLDRTKNIDRPTAERIARETLQTQLPSEETLQAMCDEGQRMGWTYGPPET
jgi:hypothetical protein